MNHRTLPLLLVLAVAGCDAAPVVVAEDPPAAAGGEAATDWPRLFGPTGDGVVPDEANVRLEFDADGPPELWRREIGAGYSCPAVVGDALLLFDRVGDRERLRRLDAATGADVWEQSHPCDYVDRYGYGGGPRCTPVVAGGKVWTLGVQAVLTCHALDDGAPLWRRDLRAEYAVPQGFFGTGATPLLEGDRLILNVGGENPTVGVLAVEAATGKTLWTATEDGASYATPTAATVHGRRMVFVLTRDAAVGLDPGDGAVLFRVPFRSRLVESVNATSPAAAGDRVVFSATYGTGSMCLKIAPDGGATEVWRTGARGFESHFSNMIVDARANVLYGFSGRNEGGTTLDCVALDTGLQTWRWRSPLGRGSLLRHRDRLLCWGERGDLMVLPLSSAEPPQPLAAASLDLDWPTWTPPAVADGRLYLRNEDTLLALDLRPTGR